MAGVLEAALGAVLPLVDELTGAIYANPSLTVVTIVVLIFVLGRSPSSEGKKLDVDLLKQHVTVGREDAVSSFCRSLGAPDCPHEEGCFVPGTDMFFNNSPEPQTFHNDLCDGKFLSLHRATWDKELNKSAEYPYGDYFLGKKRIWELRIQLQFKKTPSGVRDMYFGIELEKYVPMNRATKRTMETLVGLLKQAVGKQVYHSPGDDPQVVKGELERPIFSMPMWAFDQFIVTPEGLEAPKLTDPDIPSMGKRRYRRIKQYKKEMDELDIKVGPTYTFCFWGISQWLDRLNWEVKMPFSSPVDFNKFCGGPPVHAVIYTLKDQAPGREHDKRHLDHRKQYVMHLCFWSSKCRPSLERIQGLLADDDQDNSADGGARGGDSRRRSFMEGRTGAWCSCCTGRG